MGALFKKKCTHFLIVFSQSHYHDQRSQKFAWQIGVQVDLAWWAVLPTSNLLFDLSRRNTSNTVFGKSTYQSMELLGRIQVPSSCYFQISKHMKYLLQMSLAWQRQIRGHHWYLTCDINADNLYNPLENSYQRMVVGCIWCIQLPINTNLWEITSQERSRIIGNQILASLFQQHC